MQNLFRLDRPKFYFKQLLTNIFLMCSNTVDESKLVVPIFFERKILLKSQKDYSAKTIEAKITIFIRLQRNLWFTSFVTFCSEGLSLNCLKVIILLYKNLNFEFNTFPIYPRNFAKTQTVFKSIILIWEFSELPTFWFTVMQNFQIHTKDSGSGGLNAKLIIVWPFSFYKS